MAKTLQRSVPSAIDRKLFLAGLSGAALVGCAGSGLLPEKTLQVVCPDDAGRRILTCGGNSGGGGAYASTGGVNPGAWTNFKQQNVNAANTGVVSYGWSDGSVLAHGANDSAGNLIYSGNFGCRTNSDGSVTSNHAINMTNGPNISASTTIPPTLPAQGSVPISTSSNYGTLTGTLTNDNANNNYVAYFDVQGVPCSLSATPDANFDNAHFDYKDLSTGDVYSFDIPIDTSLGTQSVGRRPMGLSAQTCQAIEFAALFLGILALVLMIIALPAAAAGAAYAAGMWWTGVGISGGACVLSLIHAIGCN